MFRFLRADQHASTKRDSRENRSSLNDLLGDKEKSRRSARRLVNSPTFICLLFLSAMFFGVYAVYTDVRLLKEKGAETERLSTSIRVQALDFARLETKHSKCSEDLTSLEQKGTTKEANFSQGLKASQDKVQELQKLNGNLHKVNGDLRKANIDLQTALQEKLQQVKNLEAQVAAFEQQLKQLVSALRKLEAGQQ